jgi:hypothetical protein
MTARTFDGQALTPGVNVDPVDIAAGFSMARTLGFMEHANDRMVVEYALQRAARGEESEAFDTWAGQFGKGTRSGWMAVLASAVAAGTAELERKSPPKSVTVQLGEELPKGPTEGHVGMMVARVTLEAMVVARVESVGPVGNDTYVRLGDGTLRRREHGQWFVARMGDE